MPNPYNLNFLYDQLVEGVEIDQEIETTLKHPETGHPIQVSSRFHAFDNSLGWDWIYDHLQPDGNVEREVHSAAHDLASSESYLEELREAGFDILRIEGDFEGGNYSSDSPHLILVCCK